jgi:hypothetical protein
MEEPVVRTFDAGRAGEGKRMGVSACGRVGVVYASMGPRTYIRGNQELHSCSGVPAPRFNGAADLHPRKCFLPLVSASLKQIASMGPRTYIRGNAPATLTPAYSLVASMGPRTYIRGNRTVGDSL